ncbi:MAG: hypothetical protein WDA42_06070 [Candidatus Bathyarchaeia archaeon]|jgi:hypothetical protein
MYKLIKLQNASAFPGNAYPTYCINYNYPGWEDAVTNWKSGKPPTDSQVWQQGVFAIFEYIEDSVINANSSFQDIKNLITTQISDAIAYLMTHIGEEDRIEFRHCGYDIRVWTTKINTVRKIHIGYKTKWHNNYFIITTEALIEMLYKRKGSP